LSIWINSSFGKDQVLRNQGGLAQKHFNVGDMRELLVALPKPEEQRAIATALSDVDALIAALDKLIAKKRHLKTATMQQLLTGKKRLPGFGEGKGYKQTEVGVIPEDWEYDSLQDKVTLISGRHILSENYNCEGMGKPYLTGPANFENGKSEVSKWTTENGIEAEKNDILITVKGSGAGGSFRLDLEGAIISRQLMALRGKDSICQEYLYCAFSEKEDDLASKAIGNLIPGLSRKDILTFKMALPPIAEQRAIATVLSDMDSEIAAIEARRAKTQAIKQGMMQQLLTGKVRLVASA
jgi:type I restriction enzyme S subunit